MTETERNNIATGAIELNRRVIEKLDQYCYLNSNPMLQEVREEILKEMELFADWVYYADHDY